MAETRQTLGDFLGKGEPIAALWPQLLNIVFRDSSDRACLDRLSPIARTVYLVVMFDGELVNGGFGQFFCNSSGDHAADTTKALRRVGANLSAELLERALTAFPGSVAPANQRHRYELLAAFKSQRPRFLDELDEIYYRAVDNQGPDQQEDLHGLLAAFMQAHAEEVIAT